MERTCLKCGATDSSATGSQAEACPSCGAIYSKVEALAKMHAAPESVHPSPNDQPPQAQGTANATAAEHTSFAPESVKPASTPSPGQGAVVGGWVCFLLGLAAISLSAWTVLIYGPLFFASFVLAIVALAQKRIGHGIALLLLSILIPISMVVYRMAETIAGIPVTGSSVSSISGPSSSEYKKPAPIVATLLAKSYKREQFQDHINMTVGFANATAKPIRAFDGTLDFEDILGNRVTRLRVVITDPIQAQETFRWNGTTDFNQFSDEDRRLRDTRVGDLKVVFRPRKVMFADGTSMDF
jgi:hypothetical protein